MILLTLLSTTPIYSLYIIQPINLVLGTKNTEQICITAEWDFSLCSKKVEVRDQNAYSLIKCDDTYRARDFYYDQNKSSETCHCME